MESKDMRFLYWTIAASAGMCLASRDCDWARGVGVVVGTLIGMAVCACLNAAISGKS